jgi:fibronectin type 3 domain-containing protein
MAKNNVFALVVAALTFSFLSIGFAPIIRAQSADTAPPTIPGGLSATANQPSSVSLSWGASTDNVGVAGYYVYRNGASIMSVTGTSFTDSSLAPGSYQYAVAAYDAAGNVSFKSNTATAALIQDTVPPSAPTSLSVTPTSTYTSTSSVQVALSWNAATDNDGVAGYYVYRSGVKITTSTTPMTATSYTDTLPPGPWTYSYTVSAYDASGNISPYSLPATVAILYDVTPPTIPANVSARQTSLSAITLLWTKPTDNIGVTGYDIFRDGSVIGTSATTSYIDSGVTGGNSYGYAIAAYDAAGNVSASSTIMTISVMSDNAPPSVPSGLLAQAGTSSINVSWNPSVDAVGVAGYDIYRNGTQIATIATTSYLDTAPVLGSNMYSISAYNQGNIFSSSSTVVNADWYPVSTTTTSTVIPVPSPAVVYSPAMTVTGTQSLSSQPTVSSSTLSSMPLLTASLYYGLRSDQVSTLQSLLVSHGYLASNFATGFFGNLTLQAVQKFQCDNGVLCSGAGWGIVGPKTRTILNGLADGTATASSSPLSTTSLNAQLQALEQQLLNLEAQLK